MAEARHFCPDCGGIDIQIQRKHILLSEAEDTGATAKCPNCGWEGPLSSTVGAVTSEQFWDIEKIGEVLVRVVSKHAAGPFVQVMEFVGLMQKPLLELPADWTEADMRQHNELVASGREQVVKAMLAAAISAGFEEAEKVHRVYAVKMNVPVHPALGASMDDCQGERSFGGNVTPISKKGKRRG
jgi:predicted RNA-binding Zn-ribbon protein involved in translation (DUF1610 family)